MAPLKLFLDANILFSAALGGPSFGLLWEIASAGKVSLCTSRTCVDEAESNLARKRPDALVRFGDLCRKVREVPEAPERLEDVQALLPEKDAHVLAAALANEADVLLTGDVRHFGALMIGTDLPIRVCTIRSFLLGE